MLTNEDIVVLLSSVIVSLGIGLILAWRNKSRSSSLEYFLGGRTLHYVPVAVSLVVTFQSSILVLGYPAEVYTYGISHLITLIGGIPCILLTNVIAVPIFYKMKLTSVYYYVMHRFKRNANILRIYFVSLGVLFTVIYMAIVLLGPAYAIEVFTGIPVWISIVISACVAIAYTAAGGMRAVIWTDTFQFFVMVAGLLAILIKVAMVVGGVQNIISINRKHNRTNLFDFNPDPTIRHSFWALTIGTFFRSFLVVFSQQTVQRFNSTRSTSDAKKVLYFFLPFYALLHCIGDGCGLAAFAYYAYTGCDPVESGKIKNPNQIIIVLITDLFSTTPGIAGLILASLLSASLSTLSSGLNGLAAISSEELFKVKFKNCTEWKKSMIAKALVFCFGCLSTILALAMMFVKGSLSQIFISVLGALGSPVSGMFLMSIFCRRASAKGVLAGGIAGLAVSLWLSVGYNFSTTLPKTPWLPAGPTHNCKPVIKYPSYDVIVNDKNINNSIGMTKLEQERLTPFLNVTGAYKDVGTFHPLTADNSSYNESVIYKPEQIQKKPAQGIDKLYSISYQYFSVVSILITIAVGVIVSLLVPDKNSATNQKGILSIKFGCSCCQAQCPKNKSTENNAQESLM